jgi:6-phosphofructokinase
VEVLGTSGYSAVMGGISGGVEGLFIPEVKISLETVSQELDVIKESFRAGKKKVRLLIEFFLCLIF